MRIKNKFKITYSELLISFFTLLSLNIDCLIHLSGIGKYIMRMPIVVMAVVTILLLVKKRNFSVSIKLVALYWLYLWIVTLAFNSTNIEKAIISTSPCVALSLVAELYLRKDIDRYIKANYYTLLILLVLDLLSVFLFPNGMYKVAGLHSTWKYWFLGYKTERVRAVLLPLIVFSGIRCLRNEKKLSFRFYATSILALMDGVISGATAGSVSVVLLVLLITIYQYRNKHLFKYFIDTLFNYKLLIVVVFLLYFLIVALQRLDFFEHLIVDVLNKDLTLTGRVNIWTASISKFLSSPILGNGFITDSDYIFITGNTAGVSPHNLILGLLVYTGLIGLVIYFINIIFSIKTSRNGKFYASSICIAGIIVNLFLGLTSFNLYGQFHFAFFVLAYYLKLEE